MGIEVQIDGNVVLNVIAFSIRSSMPALSNSFSVLVSPGKNASDKESNLNFKAGDSAAVKIDGVSVINGFVDVVRVEYSNFEHQIELTGRDRTADFIDSSVPEINIEGAIQFEELLRTTLDEMSLQAIGITNIIPASADLLIRETKNIDSEVGQTGFEFIDQFARLKQVLLRSDGRGGILMTRGGGDTPLRPALVNIPGREENNVKAGVFVQSHLERFNTYTVRSQEDFSSQDFSLDVPDATNNSGTATDPEIRVGRNLVFEAEESSTPEESTKRAAWESDLSRAKGTKVIYTVAGHSFQVDDAFGTARTLWEPNARVPVVDVFFNIQAVMLIESVNYRLSNETGSVTEITLVPEDSYSILAARDAVVARTSIMGKEDDF